MSTPERISRPRRRASGRIAALAGLALLAGTAPGVASAAKSGAEAGSVYFGVVMSQRHTPVLKFVFSDPARPDEYAPVWGLTIAPDSRQCNVERARTLDLPGNYSRAPIYEPSNPMLRLTREAIPVFFAETVSAELARKGYTPDQARTYHACTRKVWERLVSG